MTRNRPLSVLVPALVLVIAGTGCTTALYQARGTYTGDTQPARELMLQWEAQEYLIPFVTDDVDYGSVSLQAECVLDVFLDFENHPELGLIFKERSGDFRLVEDAPEIPVGNFIVCAKLAEGQSLADLDPGDTVQLQVFCESRFDSGSSLPASLDGHKLDVAKAETETTLGCPQ